MQGAYFARALLVGVISTLVACGGGGGGGGGSSSGGSPSAGASSPNQTGVLTDSAVGGVQYTTSGGYSGTTDASGHFLYNVGETVTFKIGDLTLGAVTPTGSDATITPIELATAAGVTNADVVTNLLVLLQSLDSDGDASNGITISTAATTALTGSTAGEFDLDADPAVFIADPDLSGVVAQVNSAGGTAVVVDIADAQQHFKEEFLAKLNGTWLLEPSESEAIVFRFDANGNYIMGEYAPADDAGESGVENGMIDWDVTTGEVTAEANVDTNGEWGLSDPYDEELFFAIEGDNTLVVTIKVAGEVEEVLRWTRVVPGSNGIVGTWGLENGTNFAVQTFIFLSDGRYLMLDPVGDDDYALPDDPPCGGAGLELGSYSLSNNFLSFSNIVVDTNDCAGVHDSDTDTYSSFTVSFDDEQGVAVLGEEPDVFSLYRAGVAVP